MKSANQSHTEQTPATARIIHVIKIGGNIVDDETKLNKFLGDFAAVKESKILVHGGGKLATRMAEQLKIPQQLVDGRRITDAETLKVVTMVYAGYINKNIVAKLQEAGCNALGLSGADANLILAEKRKKGEIDYGFAGDVQKVNKDVLQALVENNFTIVVAPITHNGKGQLLNTNADTIAQEIAKNLASWAKVNLYFSFEKEGVLRDVEDESTIISTINQETYTALKNENVIYAGMIPKLDNAFAALHSGVSKVVIGKAESINELISGNAGTSITSM